jgi:hypothetical protein
MPGGDGTGPMAAGARTGRGAGYCAGMPTPGYANPGPGPGRGMGRGRGGWGRGGGGRGWRGWGLAPGWPGQARFAWPGGPYGPGFEPDPEQERQALRSQAEALQSQLDLISKRLTDLETDAASE